MVRKGRKQGTMRFSFRPGGEAGKVCLAGDFNGWKPASMRKQQSGEYALTVPLGPGNYQYKFQVDGQWLLDPDNEARTLNQYGTLNSVVNID